MAEMCRSGHHWSEWCYMRMVKCEWTPWKQFHSAIAWLQVGSNELFGWFGLHLDICGQCSISFCSDDDSQRRFKGSARSLFLRSSQPGNLAAGLPQGFGLSEVPYATLCPLRCRWTVSYCLCYLLGMTLFLRTYREHRCSMGYQCSFHASKTQLSSVCRSCTQWWISFLWTHLCTKMFVYSVKIKNRYIDRLMTSLTDWWQLSDRSHRLTTTPRPRWSLYSVVVQ